MSSFISFPGEETDEQAAAKRKQAVARSLMNPPQDMGSGIAAMGDAIAYRNAQLNNAYPAAPDGGKPSLMTAMQNFMTGGRNGRMY